MTMTEEQRQCEARRLASQLLLDAQRGTTGMFARRNPASKHDDVAPVRPAAFCVREWETVEARAASAIHA